MAKININFNNTNYEIDETAISSAIDNLASHLSTVMSGLGATINLGGVSYNIDSEKLSIATNDFVSRLGKIAGSGSKVIIGGVEYSIDNTKVNNAISDLVATLENLSDPDVEVDIVIVLDEAILDEHVLG